MSTPLTPIRIAYCITDLDSGGAERALVQLVTRLDRREWDPVVFCLAGPGPLVRDLEAAHVPVRCLGARRDDGLFRHMGTIRRLTHELRALSPRPRLLHSYLFHANFAGRIAGRLAQVERIIAGIRVAERRARWHLWLDWLTNWMVDLNVCVSQDVAEFSRQMGWLGAAKLRVIRNGVDYDAFANAEPADLRQFGIAADRRVIVTIGRLDAQKGHRFLLAAMPAILEKHNQAHLMVVGEGPLDAELRRLASELRILNEVTFVGWRPDVPRLLRASDCFVLPSMWEGMPNAVLEAMAAGVPVIATTVEGVAEVIEHGRTGLLIQPASSTAIATAVNEVLGNSDQCSKLSGAAQATIEKRFTIEQANQLWAQVYHELVCG